MNESNLSNPHDLFFKESFSRKEVARSFIREYLPEAICTQLDLKSLTILKDSFIDKELSEHFSDILYRVKISGKLSFIYLLFEHKSTIDPWTGFQLLRYMVKIWEQYRKQHENAKKLPVILPIVLYQGKDTWPSESSIGHLFEKTENTKPYIPEFLSEVFEISHIPDEQIKGEILLQVHFQVQKYAGTPQIFEKLHEILALLSSLTNEKTKTEYLETLLRYLGATTAKEQMEEFKTELGKSIEQGEQIMTTIAEKWIEEGEKRGEKRGKLEGKLETAAKMIKKNMSNEDIAEMTDLEIEKVEKLRREIERAQEE